MRELTQGNYFGEIGLLTNLRRTMTIISTGTVICGKIAR